MAGLRSYFVLYVDGRGRIVWDQRVTTERFSDGVVYDEDGDEWLNPSENPEADFDDKAQGKMMAMLELYNDLLLEE